jgi:RHS repeat-associated protein
VSAAGKSQVIRPAAGGIALLIAASVGFAQQGPDNEPAAAQGFVNNVFHSSSVDSINAFNGQLTIPIPVGPSYPVGPSLKFQAMLTYNTKVSEFGHPHNTSTTGFLPVYGNPAIGIGWTFTIGKIGWCGQSGAGVCYFGPDGSETVFYADTQNPGGFITQDASQLRLTGSGPYTMFDGDGNVYSFTWQVTGFDDTPNVNNGYVRDYGRGRNGWYLTSLKDPFLNEVQVSYYNSNANPCQYVGTLCHTIPTAMLCGPTGSSWIPQFVNVKPAGATAQQALEVVIDTSTKMISSLKFKWYADGSLAEQTATWNLEYGPVTLARGDPNCESAVLQTLKAIRLPADILGTTGYRFDYFTSTGATAFMRTMTLPTDAVIRYDYGPYHFYHGRMASIEEGSQCGLTAPPGTAFVFKSSVQTAGAGGNGPISGPDAPSALCEPGHDFRQYSQTQYGVLRRTVTGTGLETGQTDYTQYSMPFGETGNTDAETLTVVVRPADVDGRRRSEAILFLATPSDTVLGAHPGDQTGADLRRSVYDFDPNQGIPGSGAIDIPLCGGNADRLCPTRAVRNTQRVFSYSVGDINRRVTRERTYYGTITNVDATVDDYCPACPRHSVDFTPDATWETNGRHYASETHSGNLSSTYGSDSRTLNTTWDPKTTPWLRNLYTQRMTTQATTIDEKFDFEQSLGFLQGSSIYDAGRLLVYLTCRYKNSDGTLKQYFSARFPNQGPPPVTACAGFPEPFPNIPSVGTNGDAFGKVFTYASGQLQDAKWINGAAFPNPPPLNLPPWYAERYDRAPRTGWVLARYDTANLATAYVYDSLGRVIKITPPGGEAFTNIVYSSPTQTVVTRDGGIGLSTQLEYTYDSLGRLTKERRRVAGGLFVKRFRKYDPAGHEYFQSEWVTDAESEALNRDQTETCSVANEPSVTSYSGLRPSLAPGTFRVCFDPFGRAREVIGSKTSSRLTINRNDGSNWYTDTLESVGTLCVDGIWSGGTCMGGATSTTTTRRDAFGRITAVTEPDSVTTTYSYDANDKVIRVTQGGPGNQIRDFSYDAAGYLRSENTPEKGLVTYDDYGTLGNVLQQTETVAGLVRATCYDFAGRIKEIRTNEGGLTAGCLPPSGRPYVLNTYDGAGNGLGKLLQRFGYNPGAPSQSVLTETFTYSGLGGRLSSKDSTVTGSPQALGTINEQWSYNLLGLLSTHQLPKRSIDSAVTATFQYAEGLVTGITEGGLSRVSNVTYHPHGGINAWTAGNGVTTTVTADSSFLPRPLQISSTGGTGGLATGTYSYDGAGNIKAMGSDTFTYDPRSRLTQSKVWNQGVQSTLDYLYDQYGNLNPATVNPANNRLNLGVYDLRGNLTGYGFLRYDYDGLSRQTALNGGMERYLYDGAGERFARVVTSGGMKLFTINPCRLLNTQTSPPAVLGPRVVQVTGNCTIPSDASGIVGNLAAVPGAGAGFLNIYPTGTNPGTSTVNFNANQTRSGNFQLGLSGNGQVTLVASTTVNAIVDVAGYFAWDAPSWALTLRDEASRLSTDYTVPASGSITRLKNYLYLGNLLVATRDTAGGYTYYASDHLGTPRVATGAVTETHKYQPFGTEITTVFGNQPLKFAAMERDSSSGNDFDHARYQSSLLGRFLGADKVGGRASDPQSWNKYSYARNNPVKRVDPNGLIDRAFFDQERRSGAWANVGPSRPVPVVDALMATWGLAFMAPAAVALAPPSLAGAALLNLALSAAVGAAANPADRVAGATIGGITGLVTGTGTGTATLPLKTALASAASQKILDGKISAEKTVAAGIAGLAGAFQSVAVQAAGGGAMLETLIEHFNAAIVELGVGGQPRDSECLRTPSGKGCGQLERVPDPAELPK